jgi:DNA repair photolyase
VELAMEIRLATNSQRIHLLAPLSSTGIKVCLTCLPVSYFSGIKLNVKIIFADISCVWEVLHKSIFEFLHSI